VSVDEGGGEGRRMQVLVAEDTATGRAVIREHLDGEGFDLTFAEDGAQAVTLTRERAFDVVLMDLRMPVMDGLEAIRTIRADEGGRTRTPIVVVSANDSAADVRASMRRAPTPTSASPSGAWTSWAWCSSSPAAARARTPSAPRPESTLHLKVSDLERLRAGVCPAWRREMRLILCAALMAGAAACASGPSAQRPLASAEAPSAAAPAAFSSDRIIVTAQGEGPDVVLIPGLSSSPTVWAETVKAHPGHRFHLVHLNGFAGAPARGAAEGLPSAEGRPGGRAVHRGPGPQGAGRDRAFDGRHDRHDGRRAPSRARRQGDGGRSAALGWASCSDRRDPPSRASVQSPTKSATP
jgi:CheY-like chemotaxis protein